MAARWLGFLVLLAVVAAALAVRLLAAPTGAGIRFALAPGPGGTAYLADAGAGLLRLGQDGRSTTLGPLPTGSPRSLAVGTAMLLGADDGAFVSYDGVHWRRAPLPGGRFLAVAADGPRLAAASWGGGLWVSADAGGAWLKASLPAQEEVTGISLGRPDLASTLLGVLTSSDGGASWSAVAGLPARMTSVERGAGRLYATAWRGELYASTDGAGWERAATRAAGIWTYSPAAGALATTDGLDVGGGTQLRGSEVTALAYGGGPLFAGVAGTGVLVSSAGGGWRTAFKL